MRTFWQFEFPVGDPHRGPAFGERTDPSTIGLEIPKDKGPAAAMSSIGTIMGFIGNMGAASASRRAGDAQKAAADFEAAQLNQSAGQAVAASQRDAINERRRAALIVSRGLAVAAASGGGASDPTVLNLLTDIEGEGAYRSGVALYQGEEKARQLSMGASAKTYEGEIMSQGGRDRQVAYQRAGIGGLATGGASLFQKYGKGGPKPKNGWWDAGTPDETSFG